MTDLTLRSIDIPQIARFGVGFDRMLNHIDEILRINSQSNTNYPPFNMIQHDENHYTIEIAVAGFSRGEVSITIKGNELMVEGRQNTSELTTTYLYRGISGRDFKRVFLLNDYIVVKDARQENGILSIDLEREIPEEKKSRNIPITHIV